MRILDQEERDDAHESDQFAVEQMLATRAWAVVIERLIDRRNRLAKRLMTATEMPLEKIRIDQGICWALTAMIEEPDLFFRRED